MNTLRCHFVDSTGHAKTRNNESTCLRVSLRLSKGRKQAKKRVKLQRVLRLLGPPLSKLRLDLAILSFTCRSHRTYTLRLRL